MISDGSIILTIDGRKLTLYLCAKLLYNAVTGVAKELDGYRHNGEIVVKIKGK